MALYRINRRNTLFQGIPGDFVRAEPDPIMDAAVKSGIVSRMDVQEPELVAKKAKKRKENTARLSDVEPGGNDGGEDQASGNPADS